MFDWIRTRAALGVTLLVLIAAALGLRALRSDQAAAQPGPTGSSPDVIVGDIPDVMNWGGAGSSSAFSVGTTSCNIGTKPLDWVPSPDPNHPVIAQNLYRVKDGRIEQIGLSWLKHGFLALNENLCGTCSNPGAAHTLFVNCSDPYSAGLNGTQSGLGPRSQVNPSTGKYVLPFRTPAPLDVLAGRLQAKNDDLDPALNAQAAYFVEAQYIHPQDAQAGNGNNNASYRPVTFSKQGGQFTLALDAAKPTVRQMPAIHAWQAIHANVRLFNVDIPHDGRLILGIRSVQNANGFHHEIALHNLSSDRGVQALTIRTASGAVKNPGFHGVEYFGESYSSLPWTTSVTGAAMTWATDPFTANPNANALRWGTLYSFWFDSDTEATQAVIQLFKPGTTTDDPNDMTVALGGPLVKQQATAAPVNWLPQAERAGKDVGTKLTFRLTAPPNVDRDVAEITSSNQDVAAKATKKKDDQGRVYWDVTLEPTAQAKGDYFETALTLKTNNPGDAPVQVRVYGVLPKK